MSTTAIEIENISKQFSKTFALKDVSFSVPKACVFGLVGPNGAGKTTLFSLVASFLRPTAGKIRVLDIDVAEMSRLRGRLSILPQDAQFQGNVPIWDQLVFFAELSGRSRKEAEQDAMEALDIVNLADAAKTNARTLSHGMSKRLGIAQAFLGRPDVILLDEPTAGLDPANVSNIKSLIRELKKTSTVVLSSHDLHDIQELCDEVAILKQGSLVQSSTMRDITEGDNCLRLGFARPLSVQEVAFLKKASGVTEVSSYDTNHYMVKIEPNKELTVDDIIASIVGVLLPTQAIPRSIDQGMDLERKFLAATE